MSVSGDTPDLRINIIDNYSHLSENRAIAMDKGDFHDSLVWSFADFAVVLRLRRYHVGAR
ncbi:MAG: hypothetical protein LBG66_01595 [Gallionellaceae bacterium]|jgi:hypothetical protein|nr:hypothetical protein [Gallionellaceae bacterium]